MEKGRKLQLENRLTSISSLKVKFRTFSFYSYKTSIFVDYRLVEKVSLKLSDCNKETYWTNSDQSIIDAEYKRYIRIYAQMFLYKKIWIQNN